MIIAAFSICFGSSASTKSTTSKRPRVAKLPFQVMSGHSCLIFAETAAVKSLKFLGSSECLGGEATQNEIGSHRTPPSLAN
jgi:hypothetical protein